LCEQATAEKITAFERATTGFVRNHLSSKTQSVKVHLGLEKKPSGCVVWVRFDEITMKLGPFLYFGGQPGKRIPSLSDFKTAKHTKGNAQGVKAERPNLKVIPKSQFKKLDSVEELVKYLFGLDRRITSR
jgi:hypothetical protein